MTADAAASAQQRWELENEIKEPEATEIEALYKWDPDEQRAIQAGKPWATDPNYFKRVRISALALLKMAMHAKSGRNLEIMGVMQGKIQEDSFIIIDAFALPVEGTETRVNAQAEAYEYMVDFLETAKLAGRQENIVGWYHSHPGYGCWLSGIDVSTQMTNQRYQEPFLAIVVDPHRTIAAGKVELGAFRTFPEGYHPPNEPPSQYQTIPLDKVEDFGVHAKQYYQLEVSYFKSALDAVLLEGLWGRYWAATLASSPLLATRGLVEGQLADVARKLEAVVGTSGSGVLSGGGALVGRGSGGATGGRFNPAVGGGGGGAGPFGTGLGRTKEDGKLEQAAVDGAAVASELMKGLSTQVVKELLFNRACGGAGHGQGVSGGLVANGGNGGGVQEEEPMETT